MPIRWRGNIKRYHLQDRPEVLFLFGDNFAGKGLGGQAKEMRGEPNALGIPTKHKPTMQESAFLHDEDFDFYVEKVTPILETIENRLKNGGIVVMPSAGIGTGLAQLAERAPRINAWLQSRLKKLGEL